MENSGYASKTVDSSTDKKHYMWNFLDISNQNESKKTSDESESEPSSKLKKNGLKEKGNDLFNAINDNTENFKDNKNVFLFDESSKKIMKCTKIRNNFHFIAHEYLFSMLVLNYKHNQNILPIYANTKIINKNIFKFIFLHNKKLKSDLDLYSDLLSYLLWPIYLLYPSNKYSNIFIFNYHAPLYPDGNYYTKDCRQNEKKNAKKKEKKKKKEKNEENNREKKEVGIINSTINGNEKKEQDSNYNYMFSYLNVLNSLFNKKEEKYEHYFNKEKYFYTDRMNLDELSNFLLKKLKDINLGKHNDIIFVAHSMGGLLTQHVLLKNNNILSKTKFVFFYATPHFGSPLSSTAYLFKTFLSPYVYQLNNYDSSLSNLQYSFKERIKHTNIKVYSFSESEKTPLPIIGMHTMIVPSISSYLNYAKMFAIIKDCDHLEISKLNSKEDIKYHYLYKAIKEVLQMK